jgi:putative endonuclease
MRFDGCAAYLLANQNRTVLYVGVTSDLITRVAQHRSGTFPGSFTTRYKVDRLVYYECHSDIRIAIAREKQLKGWTRAKKIALVERGNRSWDDLWDVITR